VIFAARNILVSLRQSVCSSGARLAGVSSASGSGLFFSSLLSPVILGMATNYGATLAIRHRLTELPVP